eukprot:g8428.t1
MEAAISQSFQSSTRLVVQPMTKPLIPSNPSPLRRCSITRRSTTARPAPAPTAVALCKLLYKTKLNNETKIAAAADSVSVEAVPSSTGLSSHNIHTDPTDSSVESSSPIDESSSSSSSSSPEGTSSFSQALANAVNILMGVGLLSIPFSLKEGGWASLAVLAAIWTGTNYTGKILIKCQEVDQCKTSGFGRLLASYEEVGERAFGHHGRQFITTVLYAELLGTCALFFILFGDHMHFLLSQLMGPLSHVPSKEQLMDLSAGLFIPTTWLPDVSALSCVGVMGMLSALGVTGIVLFELFQHGANFADTIPVDMVTLPGSFGLLAFVFAGHAVFPSIYSSMKDKSQFPKMLNTSYMIVGATCLLMGVAGYLLYGSETMEEVTLNLPSGLLSLVATSLILVSPFAKFGLTMEPVAKGIEEKLNLNMNNNSTAFLARVNRTALGCGCLFVATQIPFFGQFMSVVGSFLTLTISVIFPSLCYMKLYGKELKNSEKLMNYSVVALGVACATSGTWTAVNEVLKQLN